MGLNQMDKINILKFLKIEEIEYQNYRSFLRGPSKTTIDELVLFLTTILEQKLRENGSKSLLQNLLNSLYNLLDIKKDGIIKIKEEIVDKIFETKPLFEFYKNSLSEDDSLISLYAKILSFQKNDIKEKNLPPIHTKEAITTIQESTSPVEEVEELKQQINKLEQLLKRRIRLINNLKSCIEKIQKDLSEAKKQSKKAEQNALKSNEELNDLQKELNNRNIDFNYLTHQKQILDRNYEKLQKKYNELKGKLSLLHIKLASIEQRCSFLEEQNGTLKEDNATKDRLISDLIIQNDALQERIFNEVTKKQLIKEMIIKAIYNNNKTINLIELKAFLISEGITVTETEIIQEIKEISSPSIINNSIPPLYKIVPPVYLTDQTINIQTTTNEVIDFLLVSDYHIESATDFKKKSDIFNSVNDYCRENHIKYIVNLGDLFDNFAFFKKTDYQTYQKIENMLNTVSQDFPFCEGIYTIVLGGNHDQLLLSYGIDPIKELTKARSDFINLGYTEGTICLNQMQPNYNSLGFFHFYKDAKGNKILLSKTNQLLQNIADKKGNKVTYFDFLGHYHKNKLDINYNYCAITSLTRSQANGALHIQVYLDSLGDINQIIFIPLMYEEKFQAGDRTLFQRTLKQ